MKDKEIITFQVKKGTYEYEVIKQLKKKKINVSKKLKQLLTMVYLDKEDLIDIKKSLYEWKKKQLVNESFRVHDEIKFIDESLEELK